VSTWRAVGFAASAAGIAIVLAGQPGGAGVNGETPPPPAAVMGPDSTGMELSGVWVSDADPNGILTIKAHDLSCVLIDAGKRFSAVGFDEGSHFVGLLRRHGMVIPPSEHQKFGVLRFQLSEPGRIRAEFADDLGGRAIRSETWSKSAGYDSAGLSLDWAPRLGEYVYVEELPEAILKVPQYPDFARTRGIQGMVLVQALVGRDGLVKDARIMKSIPALDSYAVEAVMQWRFKPGAAKGAPVAVWVAVPVKFTLH
jgi:TonB family protein